MISLTVAIDANGIIGDSSIDNLPWRCPLDLERFRSLTWGADVVVGRKTYEQLPGQILMDDGRDWRVVSSSVSTNQLEHAQGFDTFKLVKYVYQDTDCHVVIAGGASIYRQAFDTGIVDRCFITRIPIESGGDIEWSGLPDGFEKTRERVFQVEPTYKGTGEHDPAITTPDGGPWPRETLTDGVHESTWGIQPGSGRIVFEEWT